ncbi:MAG TPA: hypothetical protein VE398_13710 [Acidobacteriota bacterium]|nr:hypothetical protein [Acidobacteriota bacterium]
MKKLYGGHSMVGTLKSVLLCAPGASNIRLVEMEHSERNTLGANLLSLGEGRLIAFEENAKTNARLRRGG